MTTELPITAMLENEIQKWEDIFYCTRVWDAWNYGTMTRNDFETFSETECFDEIMEKVRTLEESSQKKAKEEERDRIIGILEDMLIMRWLENDYSKWKTFWLQEAITRITN